MGSTLKLYETVEVFIDHQGLSQFYCEEVRMIMQYSSDQSKLDGGGAHL